MSVPSRTTSGHSSTTSGNWRQRMHEAGAREGFKHQEGFWRRNDVVITAGMAVFGTGLNISFINVALYRLAREFGVGPNSVTWWFSLQPSTGGAAVAAWEVGRFKRIIEALERSPLSPNKTKN